MTFFEAILHMLAGDIVTNGYNLYRIEPSETDGNDEGAVQRKQPLGYWMYGSAWTRQDLLSNDWKVVPPDTPEAASVGSASEDYEKWHKSVFRQKKKEKTE